MAAFEPVRGVTVDADDNLNPAVRAKLVANLADPSEPEGEVLAAAVETVAITVADPAVAALVPDAGTETGAAIRAGFAGARVSGAATLASQNPATREYPMLTNPIDAPILEWAEIAADSELNGLYWPHLVDMNAVGSDSVTLLFSSDHATHPTSGIAKASASGPLALFSFDGDVWRDDTDTATQCETPSVIGRDSSGWLVAYQMAGVPGTSADQVSMVARCTGDDFASGWSRVGVLYDPSPRDTPRSQAVHTGYVTTWSWGGQFFARGMLTGNSSGTFFSSSVLLTSADGVTWIPDPRPQWRWPAMIDNIAGYDRAANWALHFAQSTPFRWGNRWWQIGTAGAGTSGTEVPAFRLVALPISDDFRRPLGRPVDITPPAQSWMTEPIDQIGSPLAWKGRLFVPFRSGGHNGAFGMLEVV